MDKIGAQITKEEKEIVDQYCKALDCKISQLVRWAVKEYMENHPVK